MTPNQQQFLAWSAIIALAGLLLWVLSPVLMPFVVAAVLAYVLSPLVKGLLRVSAGAMPVLLAVGVVELLFLVVALAILLLVVPILAKELPLMREQLQCAMEMGVVAPPATAHLDVLAVDLPVRVEAGVAGVGVLTGQTVIDQPDQDGLQVAV
jgi:predicted PurR-regulated permease PerM